jgi:hypothetical protein
MATSLCHSLLPHTNLEPDFMRGSFFRNGKIRLIAFTIIVCLLSFNATAQNKPGSTAEEGAFPKSFIGNWKGQLHWMIAGKPTQTFTMQLKIQPTDSVNQYTWQIIYGDDNKDNRPYILKPIDTSKGHWVVDERDGIVLDSYVHGDSIHGAFTVQGNTVVDNYRIENDSMFVEFFSFKLNDKKTTGKGTEETPFVDSYGMGSYQIGTLTRMD